MDFKNICLTGFMGSGKSTVGKLLAKKLGFTFIDLDRVIELAEGRKIKDIFRLKGEKYFRDLETKVTGKIYKNKNCVFACGGGIVKRKKNMDMIKSSSFNVYLSISIPDAIKRLKNVKDRPLIDVKDRDGTIEKMIKKREVLYRKYADLIIDNSRKKPGQASREIINGFKA